MPDFNRRIGRRLLLGGGAAVLALPLPAHTQGAGPAPAGDGVGQGNQQPEITVDRARTAPIPIAVPNFTGQLGTGITGVISNNLARSGLFRPIEQAAQVGQGLGQGDGGDAPNFAAWKATGAQALVTGRVEGAGSSVRSEASRSAAHEPATPACRRSGHAVRSASCQKRRPLASMSVVHHAIA